MPDLNIVIPVFDEAENIRNAIKKIEEECKCPHVITIIYDMDEDTTVPVVRQMQHDMNNLFLLKNKYGRGVLNAIKTGLEEATSKYVVVTMADLSDPPAVINEMFQIAEEKNADIVCGSRYMKGGRQIGGPVVKGLMSHIAGLTLHYLAGVPTHDSTNSFKLYRTSFLRQQKIESKGGFELGIELVAKAYIQKYKICETPTIWTDRLAGKSNFKLLEWLPGYLKWYFHAFRKHIGILLMLFCATCLCLGQLVWKLMPEYNLLYILGGFAIYAAGAMSMILAYRYGELSILQPINSMSYVFSIIIAILILHETVPMINFAGIALIVGGVIVIGTNSRC
jgi:glycosyltransferase involved in cell wall biosynthesis